MEIKSIGVVGAGQMGNGIAHVMALAGYEVRLNDISQEALDKAVATIGKNLDRQVSREKISAEERDRTMARIRTTLQLPEIAQTDLVIEAATEREEVKTINELLAVHMGPENIIVTMSIDFKDDLSSQAVEAVISELNTIIRERFPDQIRRVFIEVESFAAHQAQVEAAMQPNRLETDELEGDP